MGTGTSEGESPLESGSDEKEFLVAAEVAAESSTGLALVIGDELLHQEEVGFYGDFSHQRR